MPPIPPPPSAANHAFLGSTRLFAGLDGEGLDDVLKQIEWQLVPGGRVVCRQGEEGDSLYLVASGRLSVLREKEGGAEALVEEIGRGACFGEVSVLTGRRTATVRAQRDAVVGRLSREAVVGLLHRYPGILFALTRRLAHLLEPHAHAAKTRGCVALAVVAGEGVPADFAPRLAAELAAHGPALLVDAAALDAALGAGTAASAEETVQNSRISAWLDEQEAAHDFLVLSAGRDPSPWSRVSLREADRVLVVTAGDAAPSLGPFAPELARLEGKPREELVLLHGDAVAHPSGTAAWLELRPFTRHHHLRLSRPGDLARLARFLAGRATGLVLGGGGARGFAHIGVLRALAEAGIAIDRVGGTSMGAAIGALFARGCDWREILELNRWGWVKVRPQEVYTLPVVSLLSPVRAEKMLVGMYGEDDLEDLWLDFFCVSTNLTRAEVTVHRRGSVRRSVGSSMRLPGVAPPMVEGGDLLVDGGVLNNLPTDVMRQLGEGPIIASDVSATVDVRADPAWREAPSPWQFLAGRFRRKGKPDPFPNILRLVHRSAVLASDVYARTAKRHVELYLDLPMDRFDLFAMDEIDAIADFGYHFAQDYLATHPWPPAGTDPAGTPTDPAGAPESKPSVS